MRAAIYTRVSSIEQVDGYSLDAQRDICIRFIEARGWQVAYIYEEPGRSGKSAIRPVFQQMIQHAQRGDFDIIVVHKLDRFSRSLIDVFTYLGRLADHNVSFVSATEQFDFSTPFGKVILAMLAAFAQWYLDNLSVEISKGKAERARQGGWNGTLSFGYTTPARLRDRLAGELSEADANLIEASLDQYAPLHDTAAVPCPFDAPGVQMAFQVYACGDHSDAQIADLLNEHGYRISSRTAGNLFSSATIRDLLRNRFYLGETSYGGRRIGGKANSDRQYIPGTHDAIITEELFDQCQAVRQSRRSRYNAPDPNRKRQYLLAGILRDECDVVWGGLYAHNRRYYRQRVEQAKKANCTDLARKSVLADVLESQIETYITAIQIPDEIRLLAIQELSAPSTLDANPNVDVSKLEKKLKRAQRLYLEGDMQEDEYDRLRAEIRAKLDDRQTITPRTVTETELDDACELLKSLGNIWQIANFDERQKLLRMLFEVLLVQPVEIEGEWEVRIKRAVPTPVMSALLVYASGEDRIRPQERIQIIKRAPVRITAA